MTYQEFPPSPRLQPFVKCFYVSEYEADEIVTDQAFATGCQEVMFNLGHGRFQTGRGESFDTTPRTELWGQIIRPLGFRSLGKNKMLGVRFFPHTATLFLQDRVDHFNDRVSDFEAIAGAEGKQLYERLLNAPSLQQQLNHLEAFLVKKVEVFYNKASRFQVVDHILSEMAADDFCDNIETVAFRFGISSRYLQKLFIDFTGLTPKLYFKIQRFQKSLLLTSHKQESLTSIAYQSGYFDQSHFVRDFKLFTGVAPSMFDSSGSAALASPLKK